MPKDPNPKRNRFLDILAKVLTNMFSPITATISGILITYYKYIAIGERVGWNWLIAGFLLVIINLITLWIFIKSKWVSNWDITDRKQRPRFLLVVSVYSLILFAVTWIQGYREALPILSLFVVALLLSSFITLFWKISFHTFSVTLAVLLAFSALTYTSPYASLLFIIPFVTAWTRVYLGKHTLNQTLGGIILGVLMLWVWLILPVERLI